jgi:hypothetical protein
MAITINGSGTITGISAGGLPDGSVTADDIAAAAVTDAKIASGVSAAKLTGTLPAIDGSALTNLPGGGKVLQVVSREQQVRDTITSSSYVATSFNHTITPTSSSSKVLVMIKSGCNNESTNRDGKFTIYRGSTDLSTGSDGFAMVSCVGARIQVPMHITYLDSPNTTSAVTYTLYARNFGGTIEVPVSPQEVTTITLMEIAG